MGADYGVQERLRLAPARVLAGCYVDLGRGVPATTLIAGTGRSGSTWLAEVVNHRNKYRLVFEPFRSDRVRKARGFRRGLFIDPADQDHELSRSIDALLAGRVRGWWTDRHNRRRVATRRIVKEVRITNLLPWIRVRHPTLRIIYIVRDPVAVAKSWLELGWGDDLDELLAQRALIERFAYAQDVIDDVSVHGATFDRHLLRWCLENAIPLKSHTDLDIHLVVYERLRAYPDSELERLFAYLHEDPAGAHQAVHRLSATAGFPRPQSVRVTEEQQHNAETLMAAFGIAIPSVVEGTPLGGGRPYS